MDANDHDILIELKTLTKTLIDNQAKYFEMHSALSGRVAALESKDSRDSERVRALTTDIQRSLNNHERINDHEARLESLKEDVRALQSKSNLWDIANSLLAAIAGVIGFTR